MRKRSNVLTGIATMVLSALFSNHAYGVHAARSRQPFPANIRAAWQKAGAQTGWMGIHEGTWNSAAKGGLGDVPAFRFMPWKWHWKPDVISRLPVTNQGFGLILTGTDIADSGPRVCSVPHRLYGCCKDSKTATC